MSSSPKPTPNQPTGGGVRNFWLPLWVAASALLVLLAPSRWLFARPFAAVPEAQRTQAWVWALAAVLLAFSMRASRPGRGVRLWVTAGLQAAAIFAAGFLLLRLVLEAPSSTVLAGVSLGLAIGLALLPQLVDRWLAMLTVLAVAVSLGLVATSRWQPPEAGDRTLATALHRVTVTEYAGLVDSMVMPGGALASVGTGFVLVTGEGEFYRLRWNDEDRLTSERLALTGQFNREELRRNLAEIAAVGGGFPLRASDLAVDTTVQPHRVYLAHGYWNAEGRCLTLRVSVADLPDDAETIEQPDPWRVVFESWPCVVPSFELGRGGTGARLAWEGPGRLLLSVGDHGEGNPDGTGGTQSADNAYGKIFRLDTVGGFELVSLGHRNPQGLVVRRDGTPWSTEHGPQGGDEVNRIRQGANYGWPLVTYGVQYGEDRWPMAGERRDHAGFEEPALAFVPSLGVSNLIELGSAGFPSWEGDLLVASLRAGMLHRLRIRDDRVVYSEPIEIGRRIRDLEQGTDGRILLWLDGTEILVLSPSPAPSRAEQAYQACAGCHGQQLEGTALGPSLLGVVGRNVAGLPDFEYSPALRSVGGKWTLERLNAFLMSPEQFAPGNTMVMPGVGDTLRSMVVYYLRDYASVNSAR